MTHKTINQKLHPSWVLVLILVAIAALFGFNASISWMMLLIVGLGGILLALRPHIGLFGILVSTLLLRFEFATGTEVALNATVLLIPLVFGIWGLHLLLTHQSLQDKLGISRTYLPLSLFLMMGLVSLLIGNVTWDPMVPRSQNFTLVQVAQWAIFTLSATAFVCMAGAILTEKMLEQLTVTYLILGGCAALLVVIPGTRHLTNRLLTFTVNRSPFWMLLTALLGGQLLFNQNLDGRARLFVLGGIVVIALYAFFQQRDTASNWVGVITVVGILAWLRWPTLRWPAIILLVILTVTGYLTSTLYEFAGGDAEWQQSGGSRLALIQRVISVTMYNPITGLGPASYRAYASVEPLQYGRAFWINPQVNSHNNYVDIFAHVGLIGVALFLWFMAELGKLGWRLSHQYRDGFLGGYINGMLAAWGGSMVLMMFADWVLPFVYNIGFPGFQASALVWLFLGGLVAVDNFEQRVE